MIDENGIKRFKKRIAAENPDFSPEDVDKIAASLLELASFLVKRFINHKNQEKKE